MENNKGFIGDVLGISEQRCEEMREKIQSICKVWREEGQRENGVWEVEPLLKSCFTVAITPQEFGYVGYVMAKRIIDFQEEEQAIQALNFLAKISGLHGKKD